MKKAGSSKSKSKTRPTSKSTSVSSSKFGDDLSVGLDLAIGHSPPAVLRPQDAELFRAFQSNLLSLISHELRTPLMGVLNSLSMIEAGAYSAKYSLQDIAISARQNAERLQRTLSSLLDLAALESGNFHARLRETNLERLVQSRLAAQSSLLKDHGISTQLKLDETITALADPMKLGRAIELCVQLLAPRSQKGGVLKLRISSTSVELVFVMLEEARAAWDAAWSQALAGFQAGVASPSSAFGGVLQSEQAFLSRSEEGLGSEFLLIHEIMRLHQGRFTAERDRNEVVLGLRFPELSTEEGLRAALASRMYPSSHELGAVALGLIQGPQGLGLEEFRLKVREKLFRTSDSVFAIPKLGLLALVVDDCKPQDVPVLIQRLEKALGFAIRAGIATCPEEATDPDRLLETARSRLKFA